MRVEVEDVEIFTKKLNIDISSDIIQSKEEEVYGMLRGQVHVPGFRKGKVPLGILQKRFAKEVENEILKTLIPEYCEKAFDETNLLPTSTPNIENVKYVAGSSLTFTAVSEVYPAFELEGYQDADIDAPLAEVTDEKIDETIENIRKEYAELIIKEGKNADMIEKGDIVTLNLECTSEGREIPGLFRTYQGYTTEIGLNKFVPEIEEALLGKKKGDVLENEIFVPETYYNKEAAGKKINIKTTVDEIKQISLADLNDEFAQNISSQFKSLDELKEMVKEKLGFDMKHKQYQDIKENLKKALLEKNSFEIPPTILKKAVDRQTLSEHVRLLREGNDWKMLSWDYMTTDESIVKKAREDSAYFIMVNKLAIKEDLAPSEEDLKNALIEFGMQKRAKFVDGMPQLSDMEIHEVQFALIEQKVIHFILKRELN